MPKSTEVIWPLSVRIIHWMVAVVVVLDAFLLEDGDPPHRYWGYLAFALVLVRLILGVVGKGHVRFSSMPISFKNILFYLRHHFSGKAHFEGHNPLASIVYILMWLLIIGITITGWMMGLDAYWGDEEIETLHSQMSDGLIALVVIHLIGVFLDALIYRRKTWMSMLDGKKK